MEIERKYLVRELPANLDSYHHVEIEQGYLCTSPTLRIRKAGDAYILTVKEKVITESSALHNREEEFSLSADKYELLKAKCDGRMVSKTRYRIDLRRSEGDGMYSNLVAELDIFHGHNEGLRLVEVEFPDTATADSFVKPDWFGEDVSKDKRYKNSALV